MDIKEGKSVRCVLSGYGVPQIDTDTQSIFHLLGLPSSRVKLALVVAGRLQKLGLESKAIGAMM